MQHLENDMDDLFKRAAENYPLREGEGDWETIAKRIAEGGDHDIVPVAKNNKTKKIIVILLLVLMLPAGWFALHHYKIARVSSLPVENIIKKNEGTDQSKQITKNDASDFVNQQGDNLNDVNVPAGSDLLNNSSKRSLKKVVGNMSMKITTGKSKVLQEDNEAEFSPKKKNENAVIDITGEGISFHKINSEIPAGNIVAQEGDSKITSTEEHAPTKETKDSLKKNDNLTNQNTPKNKTANTEQRKKKIYVGIVAGPEFSKVESMSFSSTGANVGVLAGFNISKKLSLETGISWSKKYYDSEGKDFSMDKVGSSMAGMVINDLAGKSSVVEIPVKIRYDVISKSASSFFITGGIAAYIMTNEKNNYNVIMNGNAEKVTGVYNKNNYRLPAVASFSIGYEHAVTTGLQIRIEPVLKVPLKGIGVGSLPITSAGLQLGIIRRLK